MFKETRRQAATDTLIGPGTQVEGHLLCESSIRIEGEYRGDITCQGDVIVGECGVARANITSKDVIVAGKVFGDIVTQGRLTITASGQIHGNVTANSLLIQDGGLLNGICQMERTAESRSRQAAEAEPHSQAKEATSRGANHKEKDKDKDKEKEKARQAG
ncbi:bactofilin family protein [Paenibacillus mendelii]|uniref:Polymer-forming cytoskeletal protein n=1 Tax=Paenibacillus mendelii TaxID=206163 RepID=A0ABV6JJP6_9BACL|nr:polymer-forming cytoskeletal protein [Paenibacillus mendelii]MCQ6558843.1 polymer-forming cytoskeletal protein [Paenibacillus mendelii]